MYEYPLGVQHYVRQKRSGRYDSKHQESYKPVEETE